MLYWFLDERFLGTSAPDETLFVALKPGNYIVRVVDDLGRGDSREVRVEVAP
jgi:penicillin-binding protein 1C